MQASSNAGVPFVRGDVTDNGGPVTLVDPIGILLYLSGEAPITCLDAADVDDDGDVTIVDCVYMLYYLFVGTAAPPPPFPACGADPTGDALDCVSYNCP